VSAITRVTVIVPMLNEADHVEHLAADIANQDFEGEIEMLVADGGSDDGSVERLLASAEHAGLDLTLLDNPSGWVSQALNACIREARGQLLVRLDCHSRYPRDYLSRCVVVAEETGAMAVGGFVAPEGRTDTERAAACAMDSPFGGIGWMPGGSRGVRRDSDILTYGAFRRETFEKVGFFDEDLRRNQDDDFTFRIRRAGGRVVLDSTIRVHYTPRGSYRGIFRQYFEYGLWKVAVMRKHRRALSVRSMVPPAFVASLAGLIASSVFVPAARWPLAVELGAYAAGALGFAAVSVRRRGESWLLLPRVAAVFPMFHLGYGLGVFNGALGALRPARRTLDAPEEPDEVPAAANLAPVEDARG
jgi:succinoglycan biosynthesis protein ExoA